jgi:hypothetical protein
MKTVLMPYDMNDEFVVDITYTGGSQLRSQHNKLMEAVKEAEGMVAFGLAVEARKVYRNTRKLADQGGKLHRIYEVLV